MKLLRYLSEMEFNSDKDILSYEDLASNFAENIRKHCQPYLKDIQKCKIQNLYRGIQTSRMYGIRRVRQDRVPKDMPRDVHVELDRAFYNEFGVKARSNSIFAVGLPGPASDYGPLCRIWPAGKYRVIWSPEIDDLYEWLKDEYLRAKKEINYDALMAMYTEGDLCGAISSGREMMIHAEKYFFVNDRYFPFKRPYRTLAGPDETTDFDVEGKFYEEIYK